MAELQIWQASNVMEPNTGSICPLVEVPVTLDGLKNGVGCDKAHDVKIFLKIICNWFHEQVPGLTSAS